MKTKFEIYCEVHDLITSYRIHRTAKVDVFDFFDSFYTVEVKLDFVSTSLLSVIEDRYDTVCSIKPVSDKKISLTFDILK